MCRSISNDDAGGAASLYYTKRSKGPLRIRAFYVRFVLCPDEVGSGRRQYAVPESLTLVYVPRINGAPLEVNGERVRPDAPAFVALHRVRSAESGEGELVYGSTDRVRAGEAVRFEAYVGEERAVKGSFRRREGGGWRVECACAADGGAAVGASEAEVCVAGEGKVLMRERVEMAAAARRRGRRFCSRLEEIPEELGEGEGCCDGCSDEGDEDWEFLESAEEAFHSEEEEEEDGCRERRWEEGEEDSCGGWSWEEKEEEALDGVTWAVDLGIWAVCLGVGFWVSKASSTKRPSLFQL